MGAGAGPTGIAVSPDAKSVYVANIDSDNVSQYDVGSGGALTPKSPAAVAAARGPFGVAVNRDGGSVYVTNAFSDAVSQYDIGSGELLSPKSPPTVATGHGPREVAVSPVARVPTTKNECKDGGWRRFGFKNQGRCIAFVHRGPRH